MSQLCLDGNTACAMMAYKFIDFAAIYPITPSSTMAEVIEQYSAQGKKNLFGNVVEVRQTQSELGASAALHGALTTGSLGSTFTSSQGLLLMIPNLYFLAGQPAPGVVHLACRSVGQTVTTLAPDHSDIYAVNNTGMCALASRNPQETHDMAFVAHISAIRSMSSFVHFFEGFRVSHQFETFTPIPDDFARDCIPFELLSAWRHKDVLDPSHPDAHGLGYGGEIYMQIMEGHVPRFQKVPGIVEEVMQKLSEGTGRTYHIMEYTGHPEAEDVIICMGNASLTLATVVEAMVAQGRKVGCINVRLWRPFSIEHFIAALPASCKRIAVLDRAIDYTSTGEPLFNEVITSLYKSGRMATIEHVSNGRYGIAGLDLTPADVCAVFHSLETEKRKNFCVGIDEDVRGTSLPRFPADKIPADIVTPKTAECVLYAIGADGTIGACRNAMKILSDRTGCECQANFEFDGKKSGGTTISYLRFGPDKIRAQYNPETAGYIACHTQAYVGKYNLLKGIRKGGVFVLNTEHDTLESLESFLPVEMKRQIAEKEIRLYAINATKVAQSVGLGNRTNTIMILFFFKYGLGSLLDFDTACEDLKAAAKITYAKQKAEVIEANLRAVDTGKELIEQCRINYDREAWMNPDASKVRAAVTYGPAYDDTMRFYDRILRREFNQIKVSEVPEGMLKSQFPPGYAKYEKPGVSMKVPRWISEKCIQCNQCVVMCPHSCIRPMVIDADKTYEKKPEGFDTIPFTGKCAALNEDSSKLGFRIQISPLDCRGCAACVQTCPKQALEMTGLEEQVEKEQPKWDWAFEELMVKGRQGEKIDSATCSLRDLQFKFPYFLNPGSCPGCAESAVYKMLTTLFGDHMVVASAVGCILVWGHFQSLRPYITDADGRTCAVATSAFEDNSVFALGMAMGDFTNRRNLKALVESHMDAVTDEHLRGLLRSWCEAFNSARTTMALAREIRAAMSPSMTADAVFYRDFDMLSPYLEKRSHWCVGGDGWAYDIDFGGVDHLIQCGEDINVLILNNHCFANTGGQHSKATAIGAVCKNSYNGVEHPDKKMGMMMMTYGNAYVAQIALGANRMQAMRALREAEAWPGPSLVIAYCPCISHMVSGGLTYAERQQKLAVETGLWPLYRYDPAKKPAALQIDSKKPTKPVTEFTSLEQRFGGLQKKNPERYAKLSAELQANVDEGWLNLERLAATHGASQ